MTIVEKAAYLRGLAEGLGIDPASREGKMWKALSELLTDMAHEIEDLQTGSLDTADALDEITEELGFLEQILCDADDEDDEGFDDDFDDDFDDNIVPFSDEDDEDGDGEDDEEPQFDGVMYDVRCPKCGEEITFDEETLEEGSIVCPSCGETLEFDLSDDES